MHLNNLKISTRLFALMGLMAVMQMDQVTQQNAALVEEMAAAASSLRSQAQELVQTVSVFKLSSSDTRYSTYALT